MVAAGFAGSVSYGLNARWPLFCFGFVAFIPIAYMLIVKLPARAPKAAKGAFSTLSLLTVMMWSAYPIIWGVGEGGEQLNPDQETICYAVLDIVAKCVFGFVLLFSHGALDAAGGIGAQADEVAPPAKEVVATIVVATETA